MKYWKPSLSNGNSPVCNLCGANRFSIVEDQEKPIYVLQCLRCGLVFVFPQPEERFLVDHYDEDYLRPWIMPGDEKRKRMWEKRLTIIERKKDKGRLLDVGCGAGEFLFLAQKSGWDVEGTEISPYAAASVGKLLNKEIFCGPLSEAPFKNEDFDVITFWHVLEHVPDPTLYLQKAHRLLKPSGLLVIAVPNRDDWVMQVAYRLIKGKPLRLFNKTDREIHLYHFRAETLRRYLDKTGFQFLSVGPDYGITETSKRLINALAVFLSTFTGQKIYNALEVHALRR